IGVREPEMQIKLIVLALLTLTGAGSAAAQVNQALDVAIPEAPNIVRVGAADQLVYELHLTNFSSLPLRLDGLSINEGGEGRSEEHTSELQSLMRISYAVFCLKKKHKN